MKNVLKGMIAFFAVLLISLVIVLLYGILGGGRMPFARAFQSRFNEQKLVSTLSADSDDISEIKINVSSEDVFLLRSDTHEIVIKEYISSQSDKTPRIKLERQGNRLNIRSENKKISTWLLFGSTYRYVEVYLPVNYRGAMAVGTSSGDICGQTNLVLTECSAVSASGKVVFEKLTADRVELSTSSGEINVSALKGDTKVITSSGAVMLDGADGRLSIDTSSGSIKVEQLSGSARARTSSGDIELRFAAMRGNLDIGTSSGKVYCELPEQTAFQFQANTSSGGIKTDFDNDLSFNRRGTQAEGVVGGAAAREVTVNTSSGNVEFRLR